LVVAGLKHEVHPGDIYLLGASVSVWNAVFALAVAVGYVVFRASSRAEPLLSHAGLRYLVVVYLSAIAAQVFAYAFDANTSLVPPPGVSYAGYYLDPLAGPKTLYGVIVLMPISVALATMRSALPLGRALDLWTPAMLVVLAIVRVGCFLQGCCYGAHSNLFGVSFPAGSSVYYQQINAGVLNDDAAWSLQVVPTQLLESLFLAMLAAWSWKVRGASGRFGLFLPAVAAYSVFRFAIEFVRADATRGIYGPLATSQWIALLVIAATLAQTRRSVNPRRTLES
jgi:phosphatidylglycerol:prolipoprotein diacylglycerol transferase